MKHSLFWIPKNFYYLLAPSLCNSYYFSKYVASIYADLAQKISELHIVIFRQVCIGMHTARVLLGAYHFCFRPRLLQKLVRFIFCPEKIKPAQNKLGWRYGCWRRLNVTRSCLACCLQGWCGSHRPC